MSKPVTESIFGRIKDEFPADIILIFYNTNAKAYYILSLNHQLNKAEGIKKNVIEKELLGEYYKNLVRHDGVI